MPITLPPISRRRFIAGSVAALAVGPRVWAGADVPVDPHRFALLSDVHIAGDRAFAKEGACPWEALAQALGEILALPVRPAAVIVNGDLAFHQGNPEDYATFVEAVAPLRKAGLAVHLGMGNHDDRANFWEAVNAPAGRPADVRDRQVLVIEGARANLFMLDSLGKTAATPGALGERQLAWLGKALDARRERPAVVFVHHDPGTPAVAATATAAAVAAKPSLTDVKAFYDVIRPRKHVKAYVFGHTHEWQRAEGAEGLQWGILPTTAGFIKTGRARGWTYMTLAEGGATFELRCLDPKHEKHGEKFELKWR
jgi:metallophosphoesterase superfamily enzyme